MRVFKVTLEMMVKAEDEHLAMVHVFRQLPPQMCVTTDVVEVAADEADVEY